MSIKAAEDPSSPDPDLSIPMACRQDLCPQAKPLVVLAARLTMIQFPVALAHPHPVAPFGCPPDVNLN